MSVEKLNINTALEEVKNASFDEQFKKICESDIEDEEDEIFDDEMEDAIEFDDDDDDESEEEPVYNKVISDKDLAKIGEK